MPTTDEGYSTQYDECLTQIENLKWKYDLPGDIETKIDDILDQGSVTKDREQTAERLHILIQYILTEHSDYEYSDQLRDYLNGVMTSLYGND